MYRIDLKMTERDGTKVLQIISIISAFLFHLIQMIFKCPSFHDRMNSVDTETVERLKFEGRRLRRKARGYPNVKTPVSHVGSIINSLSNNR